MTMLKRQMLYRAQLMLTLTVLFSACSKEDGDTIAVSADGKPVVTGKVELAPPLMATEIGKSVEGISIDGLMVTTGPGADKLIVTGTLHNKGKLPVPGVDVVITFKGKDGTVIGGHSSAAFLEPAVLPSTSGVFTLEAPMLKAAVGRNDLTAKVDILARRSEGRPSPVFTIDKTPRQVSNLPKHQENATDQVQTATTK